MTNGDTGTRAVRVDLTMFQWLCMKTKAKRNQVHLVDVSEAVFGASAPFDQLPKRVWKMVDDILDDYLAKDGYATKTDGNRVWLLLPKQTRSLGEMKARVVFNEIRRRALEMTPPSDGSAELPNRPHGRLTNPKSPKLVSDKLTKEELELRRQATLAIQDMTVRLVDNRITPADLVFPEEFGLNFVPIWNIENSFVVGYGAELSRNIGWGESTAPVTYMEHGRLDLPILAAAVKKMNEFVEAEKLLAMSVPIQWDTLDGSGSRAKLIEIAAGMRDEGRRMMMLTVEAVPEDLLSARVDDRLRQFAPFFRLFSLSIRLGRKNMFQIKELSMVKMYNVDLGKERWDEEMNLAELDLLMKAVAPFKKPMHVSHVSTKSQLVAALSAGARRISGSVVPDDGEFAIRHLTLSDLYLGHKDGQAPG